MKIKNISLLFAGSALMLAACQPDDYDLGQKDVTADDLIEGLAYSVEVNQTTNEVTFKNLLGDKYTALWSHPQGRSQKNELTIKIPFAGTYEVQFGVETRGGIVYGEPYTFTIDKIKPELLQDPLWTVLSGGVGKSKTWVLDLTADGQCKHFVGPLYFYGTKCSWLETHAADHGSDTPAYPSSDCWNWDADWAGNGSWLFGSTGAMDYGSMTFDLKDGANVVVEDLAAGKTYKGTYLLDTDNHTLKMTDAPLLHDPGREAIVSQWGNITIMSMTDDYMQLGVLRDSDPSEGPCLLVYNFISKDYADNWKPEVEAGSEVIEDPYTGNAGDELTTVVTTTLNWTLNEKAPYDWFWWNAADGAWQSNGFASAADYESRSWAPVVDKASIKNFKLMMTKTKDSAGQYEGVNTAGEAIEGKYTIDEADPSWITFDKEITLLKAQNDNRELAVSGTRFRMVKKDKKSGDVWLGVADKYSDDGQVSQYLCVKLQQVVEGGTAAVPARKVACDNSKLLYGDLEGKGNFRIEIYNSWGSGTASDSPVNRDELNFEEKCMVTFTISGLGTLSEPATAFLMCSNANVWSATDAGVVSCQVTGDGTYTVGVEGTATGAPDVFLIDIVGVGDKTTAELDPGDENRCPGFTVSVDAIAMDGSEGSAGGSSTPATKPSVKVDCDNSKILYGDIEEKGNYRIEIYNSWGAGTATDSPVNRDELVFSEKCMVSFTVTGLGTLSEPVTAFLMCSNANVWSATDAGVVSCQVTGDGTYTVGVEGEATAAPDVFLIDLIDVAGKTTADLTVGDDKRCAAVTATINSIKMD